MTRSLAHVEGGGDTSGPGRGIGGRLIDYEYWVGVDDVEVHTELISVLSDSLTEPAAPEVLSVTTVGPNLYDLEVNGRLEAQRIPRVLVTPTVTWTLNQRSLQRAVVDAETNGSFVLHAGAVEIDSRGVLLVGESGAGKSTAAIGLGREGFGYITDDVVVLDSSGVMRGSKKPVGLRPGGVEVLGVRGTLERSGVPGLAYMDSVAVAASSLGVALVDSVPASLVVFLAGAAEPGRMTPLRRSIALARVVESCFGPKSMSAVGFESLARLIITAPSFEWTRGTAGDLASTLRDLLAEL